MATTFDEFLADSAQFVFDLLQVDDKFRLARVNRRTFSLFSAECCAIAAKCTDETTTAVAGSITLFLDEYDAEFGLYYAAEYHKLDLVSYLLKRRHADIESGLCGACRGGHRDLVELMIDLGAQDYDDGLESACSGGHRDLVEMMIELGAFFFDKGLVEACSNGYRDIAEMMVKHGADNFDDGLVEACSNGYRDIAEMMVKHGADNFDEGLEAACSGGHCDLAEMMIGLGAGVASLDYCLWKAHKSCNRDVVEMLYKRGALDFRGVISKTATAHNSRSDTGSG